VIICKNIIRFVENKYSECLFFYVNELGTSEKETTIILITMKWKIKFDMESFIGGLTQRHIAAHNVFYFFLPQHKNFEILLPTHKPALWQKQMCAITNALRKTSTNY
jgi:hypothetical protein